MIDAHDPLTRRCPRLGGRVAFKYCRTGTESDPICAKIFDCWWEIFDVQKFLAAHLPPEEFEKLTQARPPSKINTILDMISQAQKRTAKP
ncbi:MAG: hypothetical protein WBG37_00525 [Desulfobacterales bacterium]|jgi:hypothetical protein